MRLGDCDSVEGNDIGFVGRIAVVGGEWRNDVAGLHRKD